MPNNFFNASGTPSQGGGITSPNMRSEFAAIAAGFDKLPTLTGNGYKVTYINSSGTAIDVIGGSGLLVLSATGIPTVLTPGTGVATALAVNVGSAGAPVLFNGAGGTPSSMVGTNITGTAAGLTAGAVAVGGITGLGTGVATALAVNIGSAGAPVLFNGAGGTPTSLVGTNITGTAAGLTAGNVSTNANLTGHVTSVGNAAVLGSFTLGQLNTAISDADVLPLAGGNLTGGINGVESIVASATTPDIFNTTVGNLIDYTGTATCTAFVAAPQSGAERTLVCAGAAVFTASANMLIDGVASGVNFTAAAGDKIIVRAVSTNQFRLTPQKYNGAANYAGKVVQRVDAAEATVVTCTTVLPYDNTSPQNTEGDQVITVTITPTNASNRLQIEFTAPILASSSAPTSTVVALFQDTTADALGVSSVYLNPFSPSALRHEMAAGTTSATTFKIRIGPSSAGPSIYTNASTLGAPVFNLLAKMRLSVTEVMP